MTSSDTSWIDVAAIEHELTTLWAQASSEDDDTGVVRSSILNLLTYVPEPGSRNEVDNILIDITASHPCRAILMVTDRKSPEPVLDAQVTSRCTLPAGSTKQVCCEQITINAAGSGIEELPSAIAPLLLSDLPVYLWWRAVPRMQDKTLFRHLADMSDRVIIDSALFNAPHSDLVSMAAVLRESPRWTAISDLNWARLNAWRALLAGFYDVAEYRPMLDQNLASIEIEYAPHDAAGEIVPVRVLLLAGWLASRLGWKINPSASTRTERSLSLRFDAAGRQISVDLVRTTGEIKPGHIARVSLSCSADRSASFSVWRSADGQRIETAVTQGEKKRVQRVLSYESLSEAALVGKEIEILGHDRVYEQAVVAAGEIVDGY
jgi:glucose-6-phosphate dehydrogenase assembly protein OpcA